ncbi:MAG: hypothetical protein WBV98_26465, partial [Candidatus Sulfotelmatobacter sp.]
RRSQFHQTILSSHVTASNLTSRQALEHLTNLIQQSGVDCVTARQKASALLYRMLQQQASLLSYVDVFSHHGHFISGHYSANCPHASTAAPNRSALKRIFPAP